MNVITGSISTYVFTMVRSRPLFLALMRAPGLLHAGTWQAVHGMIDPGETAHAAAYREAVEESGLTPARFFRVDYIEQFYSEHTDAVHLVPAFAAYVEDAPLATISHEHTAHEWCAFDEVLVRFIWRSQREAVTAIAESVASWPDIAPGMTELRNAPLASSL